MLLHLHPFNAKGIGKMKRINDIAVEIRVFIYFNGEGVVPVPVLAVNYTPGPVKQFYVLA